MNAGPATVVYIDDADPFVDRVVTNHYDTPLTFSPTVAVGPGAYEITAVWQGDPGTVRTLRIPLAGIPAGTHRLYLQVPGGTDFKLEPEVLITERT